MQNAPRSGGAARLLLLVAFFLGTLGALLVLPRSAHAAGTVTLQNREPTENDGRWKLNMAINYGGIPHMPHISMLFVFTPTAIYERALTDKGGDKPQLIKQPLRNQTDINESLDVGFSDASGKIFPITKFDFIIRRDHGFEAGEYDMKVKRADDGVQIGQTVRLVLNGDNVIVDRRAMVFSAEKKPKKVKADDADKKTDEADKKPDESAAEAPSDAPPAEAPKAEGPPPVPPKQGGCGCRVTGEPAGDGAALAAIAMAAAIFARRRRPELRS